MGPEAFSRDEAEIPNVTVLFPLISFAKPKRKLESREVKGPVQRGQSSGYRAGQRRFGEAKENTQHTKNIHKGRVSF